MLAFSISSATFEPIDISPFASFLSKIISIFGILLLVSGYFFIGLKILPVVFIGYFVVPIIYRFIRKSKHRSLIIIILFFVSLASALVSYNKHTLYQLLSKCNYSQAAGPNQCLLDNFVYSRQVGLHEKKWCYDYSLIYFKLAQFRDSGAGRKDALIVLDRSLVDYKVDQKVNYVFSNFHLLPVEIFLDRYEKCIHDNIL